MTDRAAQAEFVPPIPSRNRCSPGATASGAEGRRGDRSAVGRAGGRGRTATADFARHGGSSTRRLAALAVAPVVLLAAPALAQYAPHPISTKESRRGDPESERWATITHPGNAPYVFDTYGYVQSIGRVDYEFQISRTEVTVAEWFEFVNAYAPYVIPNDVNTPMFTSRAIRLVGPQTYGFNPLAANLPADMGWRYAARYINWLHNGKAMKREAFEQGVYDTSTFSFNPDGTFNDQRERSPGARYWIPTRDEWVKSSYFDPNRYGPGQPGYWQYPNASDTPLVIGPPGVGQTSGGGSNNAHPTFWFPPVGSYTDVQSPWGLWDISGGYSEWTETVAPPFRPGQGAFSRYVLGSDWYDHVPDIAPEHDWIQGGSIDGPNGLSALRLARAVPAPAPSSVGMMLFARLAFKRRRSNREAIPPDRVCRVCSRVPVPRSRLPRR